jgi:isoaspartyl peptidase/L-asparaginase-like protein (Ntn-hydrolase superfamily)
MQGKDLLSCVEQGLAACELDPSFLAIGLGALPNSDGEVELDAAIMDGRDLSAGAACAVRNIVPVISLARKVKEKTPHVMLAGDQAKRFAIEQGFEPRNLMTAENIRRYDEWRAGRTEKQYVHAAGEAYEHRGDTVTLLGLEDGHTVAGCSTSGIAWKAPGRVGDSPIVGAGLYADDEVGSAGATGLGEELWKACASFRAVELMRGGKSPQEACEAVARQMIRRQPAASSMACVVFALAKNGEFGAATTTAEFPLWICRDGRSEMRVYKGLDG